MVWLRDPAAWVSCGEEAADTAAARRAEGLDAEGGTAAARRLRVRGVAAQAQAQAQALAWAKLRCSELGPADVMVASDMLSVQQDAMFGAGHAKWGDLDPSILVLRARPGAVTFAQQWRAWLLEETGTASTARGTAGGVETAAGWAGGAAPLLMKRLRRGAWPGIEELSVPGVRQNSRRAEARACSPFTVGSPPAQPPVHAHAHAHAHAYM